MGVVWVTLLNLLNNFSSDRIYRIYLIFLLNREGARDAKGKEFVESERTIRQRYRPSGQDHWLKLFTICRMKSFIRVNLFGVVV